MIAEVFADLRSGSDGRDGDMLIVHKNLKGLNSTWIGHRGRIRGKGMKLRKETVG